VAIEPESITEVDEATRDAWVAETTSQTRKRLEAFETGDVPFSEEATEAYSDDVSAIEAAVATVDPDDAA
jgi:RPA family protein